MYNIKIMQCPPNFVSVFSRLACSIHVWQSLLSTPRLPLACICVYNEMGLNLIQRMHAYELTSQTETNLSDIVVNLSGYILCSM